MAIKGYDNIYDFRTPEEMAKPGDTVLQPSEKLLVPYFNKPGLSDVPGEYEKLLEQKNQIDPETEAQFPNMSLDSEKPNTPPRKAYLSDLTPSSEQDKEEIKEDVFSGNWDSGIEVQTTPDPYIEKIARSILAEYRLEKNPVELDLTENIKVAWTLDELFDATSKFSLKYKGSCSASPKRVRNKIFRYDFHVICGESWSNPTGHIVKLKFLPKGNQKKAVSSKVLISCSCEFWQFYGCDWNSLKKDYSERQMGNGEAPTIRGKRHLICKHVANCVPLIKEIYLKTKRRS
jgi:hypothetical protein